MDAASLLSSLDWKHKESPVRNGRASNAWVGNAPYAVATGTGCFGAGCSPPPHFLSGLQMNSDRTAYRNRLQYRQGPAGNGLKLYAV